MGVSFLSDPYRVAIDGLILSHGALPTATKSVHFVDVSVLFRHPYSAFILRLLNNLQRDLSRHRIIMRELHVE